MNNIISNSVHNESLTSSIIKIEISIKSMRETMNHYIENHLYYDAVFYAENAISNFI